MESVPTEEEAAEYLEQLPFEEEKEHILLSCCCFFPGRKMSEIGMFACYEIQSFHTKNRENKRYLLNKRCLLSVKTKPLRISA